MLVDLNWYLPVAAAIFGLLFGSFLNVCIYRIPRDLSVIRPRSFCPECGQQLAWYDNIPVLSYAVLLGKGRCCGKAIGLRYPIVEMATSLAFFAITLRYGWTLVALKWCLFEAILIVLFWTDLEERILPDELTLGGIALGIILALFVPVPSFLGELLLPVSRPGLRSLLNAALGGVLLAAPMWLVGKIYQRIRHREGLGLGDVKLLALFGVFLGLEQGLGALMVGAVSGSVVGLILVAVKRKAALTYELPFGSFLCVGAALVPLLNKVGEAFGPAGIHR